MDEYRKNCPTHNLIEINLNFLEISFSNLAWSLAKTVGPTYTAGQN
jgi:hypothetical protein